MKKCTTCGLRARDVLLTGPWSTSTRSVSLAVEDADGTVVTGERCCEGTLRLLSAGAPRRGDEEEPEVKQTSWQVKKRNSREPILENLLWHVKV